MKLRNCRNIPNFSFVLRRELLTHAFASPAQRGLLKSHCNKTQQLVIFSEVKFYIKLCIGGIYSVMSDMAIAAKFHYSRNVLKL